MRVAPRSAGKHGDFITRFTQGESQTRISKNKRPEKYTAEQRAELRRRLDGVAFVKPAYADNTKINIIGILRKWKGYATLQNRSPSDWRLVNNRARYCEFTGLGPWKDVIMKADKVKVMDLKATVMDFLDYLCSTFKITSAGTSWEYFRQFKLLYTSVTGKYMNTNDSKEIQKASRCNAPFFSRVTTKRLILAGFSGMMLF